MTTVFAKIRPPLEGAGPFRLAMSTYNTGLAREWWEEAKKNWDSSDVLIAYFPASKGPVCKDYVMWVDECQPELMEAVVALSRNDILWKMWSVEVEGGRPPVNELTGDVLVPNPVDMSINPYDLSSCNVPKLASLFKGRNEPNDEDLKFLEAMR